MNLIGVGDTVVIQGCLMLVRNRNRRWWQFWKPKLVFAGEDQQFRVTDLTAHQGQKP